MNAKKTLLIVLLVAVAGYAVYRIVKDRFTSEEARIRKLIREIEEDFESKELKKCLAVVSEEYSDNFLHDSKTELEGNLRLLFRASRTIQANVEDISIRIDGDEADVALTATGTASTTFGDVSLHREVGYTRFLITTRKEHGRWKVFRVQGVD